MLRFYTTPRDTTGSATAVAQFRSVDVVLALPGNHRQRAKAVDDLSPVARARETLEQLPEHKAGRDHGLFAFEGSLRGIYFR